MKPAFAELRLIVACAGLEPNRAAALAALGEPLDWSLVLRLAHWHGVRPLLHRHLSGLAPERVPRPALVELWGAAESIARANRALADELARIAALFERRAIRSLPYKGPTLALGAYGELSLREFSDLDWLVPRADLAAARRALVGLGYRPEPELAPAVEAAMIAARPQYHLAMRSPAGLLVELHWKTDPDFPIERDDDAWWESAPRVRFEETAVRAFTPEERMLVLCLHGSKHRWECLGWLVDVAELLARDGALEWNRIADRAHRLGCARRVGTGLWLAQEVLGCALPPGSEALADDPAVAAVSGELARGLLSPDPAVPPQARALRLNLAMLDRPRQRIRLVAETVLHPSLVEWMQWPLPRALFFLYPALRVVRLSAKYSRRVMEGVLRRGKLQT